MSFENNDSKINVEASYSLDTYRRLAMQLPKLYDAYELMVNSLNQSSDTEKGITHIEMKDFIDLGFVWLEADSDKVAYVERAIKADPESKFILVATPNRLVSSSDLKEMAKQFGVDKPYRAFIANELYDQYTPEELSGSFSDDSPIRFILIPNKFPKYYTGTTKEQRHELLRLQIEKPFLRIPSVVEAVAYWYALQSQGEILVGPGTYEKTYIRHFDLPERRNHTNLFVPYTFIGNTGSPHLHESFVRNYGSSARIAVG